MFSPLVMLGAALALVAAFGAGTWTGIEWEQGAQAQRDLEAKASRDLDAREQRQFGEKVATRHALTVDALNTKLGAAYADLAALPRTACLDARSVGVLNATGADDGGAAAGKPADSASAAASPEGGHASNASVGSYIAYCRTEYGKVADQLNQILDIEDRRHPPAGAKP